LPPQLFLGDQLIAELARFQAILNPEVDDFVVAFNEQINNVRRFVRPGSFFFNSHL
jgi:hypothetical protein